MGMSVLEFISLTGAELIGNNLIHGLTVDRNVVGFAHNDEVELNELGDALIAGLQPEVPEVVAEVEAPRKRAARSKPAERETAVEDVTE